MKSNRAFWLKKIPSFASLHEYKNKSKREERARACIN
jgi:hypothetical protein